MMLNRHTGEISHHRFRELPRFLSKGDALVINNTRVIPARMPGRTEKGADIEFLFVEWAGPYAAKGMVKGLRKLKPGMQVDFGGGLAGVFIEREVDFGVFRLNLPDDIEFDEWLEKNGRVPIPPYLGREDETADRQRYQTVFAEKNGSCAAPTAGLHFTENLLEEIRSDGIDIFKVCLHVGPGTFRPVTESDIRRHELDGEYAEISDEVFEKLVETKARGGRVIAVGSTVVRALETAVIKGGGFADKTSLFIRPGFRFLMMDGMVTNFHLPESSLLMLVSAFAGRENVLKAYGEAVRKGYRFYSYGDAMLIL